MANHTVDCEVCGDDLRGSSSRPRCTWTGCPGYVIGKEEITRIANEHPDADLRAKAVEIRERDYPAKKENSKKPT
jgi:ssDNA-binding Zn-finger/Zn-ribbon topoisomerase 1